MDIREINSSSEIKASELRRWIGQLGQSGFASHRYVASDGDRDVGFLELDLYDGWDYAIVFHLFVLGPYRRLGIGTQLLSHAEQVARVLGYKEIWIEPRPLGDPALSVEGFERFYLQRGYRRLSGETLAKALKVAAAGR